MQGNSFPPIFVTWNSVDDWKPGCGALWFSPRALEIRDSDIFDVEGEQMVPIESFLWVLDPERLCHPITGRCFFLFILTTWF